jgi:hypothetical protein
MDDLAKTSRNYRIEISGWGFDTSFFVEDTDLLWDSGTGKHVSLRHEVPEGAIVFVRLLFPDAIGNTLPVAYQVAAVQPMNRKGWCEMHLRQLHPGTKVSQSGQSASYAVEDSKESGPCETQENLVELETEEVLR